MCTENGRAALRRFVAWAGQQGRPGQNVHLVIAGDLVDFLAEEREGGFQPFTSDNERARAKLELILSDTREVWSALSDFVKNGHSLTILLGNHDLELSLPGPRRLLLDTLGPGRVEFLYDNQALTLGPVLVEHGNRYDDWNAVPHDDLREVRSRLSRGESATFDPLPGSRMVVELVNPIKETLAFVDLLKPEDAALLPFLALFAPNRFRAASAALKNRIRSLRVRYGAGQQPKDRNYIGLTTGEATSMAAPIGTGSDSDDILLQLAEEAAAGGDPNMASIGDALSFLTRWKIPAANAYHERQLDLLLRTLRAFRKSTEIAFNLDAEKEQYLAGATESAAHGFKVIVYGHTHLAKKVNLRGRKSADGTRIDNEAVYLNSGTWADLMAVPKDALGAEGESVSVQARERLRGFADDLVANRVESWRRLLPTFADVSIHESGSVEAEVCLLDELGQSIPITSEIIRNRLQGGAE